MRNQGKEGDMGISELRQLGVPRGIPAADKTSIGTDLVRRGVISRSDLDLAQIVQRHCDAPLDDILQAEGLSDEPSLLAAHAARLGARTASQDDLTSLPEFHSHTDPRVLIRHGVLPVTDHDGQPAILTHGAMQMSDVADILPHGIDPTQTRLLLAPRTALQTTIAQRHRDTLTKAAQARVPALESCRRWGNNFARRLGFVMVFLAGLLALSLAFPVAVFGVFVGWAALTLIISAGLKTAAFIARMAAGDAALPSAPAPQAGVPLPKVSVLVPLLRETEIAHHLIARLSRLTYPKCLLDVVLVLEEEDETTRETLATIDLPPWMRAVIVPDGQPRTKPRAMNYALDFCEGDIVGIFDAEDAPDPDQITRVARRFQTAPPDLVCLQGILDYYNSRQNWLARCFTIEYATWFRVMLPGMSRLGLAIPLGGTTLYFRRHVLEELGGWDAHNVTDDADLGFRLARHGYLTEMIETVTEEEANCRPWPWIKQRSRWLKGYMTTYLVHMRAPRRLYAQLGAWKFWGFQAHFVSAVSQVLLAPMLWSFWLVLFGLPHPLDPVLPRVVLTAIGSLFLTVEVLNACIHAVSVARPKHRHLIAWVAPMHFYSPLGAVAAYKALYELVCKPFFWDKTAHGLSVAARGQRGSDGRLDLAGIKLEPGHEGL